MSGVSSPPYALGSPRRGRRTAAPPAPTPRSAHWPPGAEQDCCLERARRPAAARTGDRHHRVACRLGLLEGGRPRAAAQLAEHGADPPGWLGGEQSGGADDGMGDGAAWQWHRPRLVKHSFRHAHGVFLSLHQARRAEPFEQFLHVTAGAVGVNRVLLGELLHRLVGVPPARSVCRQGAVGLSSSTAVSSSSNTVPFGAGRGDAVAHFKVWLLLCGTSRDRATAATPRATVWSIAPYCRDGGMGAVSARASRRRRQPDRPRRSPRQRHQLAAVAAQAGLSSPSRWPGLPATLSRGDRAWRPTITACTATRCVTVLRPDARPASTTLSSY